mmetsp:Transcript_7235/g.15460  ORF Transcript_7235/g.15460 Transcript_7235/m.15460 type:complete len:211 (+) Transcript_7235:1387-2019(+)
MSSSLQTSRLRAWHENSLFRCRFTSNHRLLSLALVRAPSKLPALQMRWWGGANILASPPLVPFAALLSFRLEDDRRCRSLRRPPLFPSGLLFPLPLPSSPSSSSTRKLLSSSSSSSSSSFISIISSALSIAYASASMTSRANARVAATCCCCCIMEFIMPICIWRFPIMPMPMPIPIPIPMPIPRPGPASSIRRIVCVASGARTSSSPPP